MKGLTVMAMMAMSVLIGCSSFGRTVGSDDTSTTSTATVEVGEVVIESTLPTGCVTTIEELTFPYFVQADDERLRTDHLVVVRKEARRVMLFQNGQLRHDRAGGAPDCWRIGLGHSPVFDKMVEGDGRTPEGWFRTSDKPWSSFYGAISVHYPSERHASQAFRAERITKSTHDRIVGALKKDSLPPQSTALGGNILLHGGGSSSDWTLGCIALANHDIDELRGLLPKGMKTWILILP